MLKVGDRVLIITSDFGLTYFQNTIQTICKINKYHYYFNANSINWAFLPKHAIPVTPLIEALV